MFDPEDYIKDLLRVFPKQSDPAEKWFGDRVFSDFSPVKPNEKNPAIAVVSVSGTQNEETTDGLTPSYQVIAVSILAVDHATRKRCAFELGQFLRRNDKVEDLDGPSDGLSPILEAFVRTFEVTLSFE